MTTAPDDLVARTRAVDAELDLLALAGGEGLYFERSRVGLSGRGVACAVPRQHVEDALRSIRSEDPIEVPGTGPVAFGALPFVPDPDTTMIVPEIVWGRSANGSSWVTTIRPTGRADADDLAALCTPPPRAPVAPPERIMATPVRPPDWWCDLVTAATAEMARDAPDGLRKVVLAREVLLEAERPFDKTAVLGRLRSDYADCFVFHVDGFLGASPELLVGRADERVRAQPMAGTAPRGRDPHEDALLGSALAASPTYRHEHQITIDMVYDTLLPWCSYLDYEAEPSVIGVANVQHLATLVEGRLSQPLPTVLELVDALHPTPAVNGSPRALARAWIAEHEGFDRGRYAGAVGWIDGRGNGEWAVSIRCADVMGATARLYAGNGIVAGSDPTTELAETEAKLSAMRTALTAPG
ncbi:MAG: isochorismate synthase [Acidimicrobiales bacterium]